MQLELIQFRHSPYNEKVRWVLDHKRLPHRRVSLLPGPHVARLRRLTGGTTTPVLVVDGVPIDGSAAIVEKLEAMAPEPALMPADPQARRDTFELQRRFDDDWVPRLRRSVLHALLSSPRYFAAVFGEGRSPLVRGAYAMLVPMAAPLVRKGNGIAGEASVSDGLRAGVEALDEVARRSEATGYLAGDRFSLADIVACAGLAPVLALPGTPMAKPEPACAAWRELAARFHDHPGAAWARGIYAKHRGASRDFDGPSSYAS